MSWLLIVILVGVVIFFLWQLGLFIRDLIKHFKQKKEGKNRENDASEKSDRKEDLK